MFTYEDLLSFVERNDYQNKKFNDVITLYKKEALEYFDCMTDNYFS